MVTFIESLAKKLPESKKLPKSVLLALAVSGSKFGASLGRGVFSDWAEAVEELVCAVEGYDDDTILLDNARHPCHIIRALEFYDIIPERFSEEAVFYYSRYKLWNFDKEEKE